MWCCLLIVLVALPNPLTNEVTDYLVYQKIVIGKSVMNSEYDMKKRV